MRFSSVRLTLLIVAAVMMLASAPAHARGRRYSGRGRGGYGGYGMMGGWGTQWMMNPYQGYLNGAANLTMANAQYQIGIQQARLLREQARRSVLETRRAALEEREYERSLQPDPEQIRQKQMMRSLERSRNNPPLVEIWSGDALNDLLRDIESAGVAGPEVPLSPEILRHINVTTGTTYSGIGLLRDGGKLTWPYVLRHKIFDAERKQLDKLLPQAVKQAHKGPVGEELLNNIHSALEQLERSLEVQTEELTPGEFTEASRYLRELKQASQVLQQNDAAKYFHTAWTPHGATVEELVQQMTREGLHFAPAVSGDEPYYTSLHRALLKYDLGVAQLAAPLLQSH